MPTLKFHMLDMTYKIIGDGVVVLVFGKTEDGKRICVLDDTFEPYFYVLPEKRDDIEKLRAEIEKTRIDQDEFKSFVKRTEVLKKKLLGKSGDVIKVTVNNPKAVPPLKEEIRKKAHVRDIFEADILFVRRYLIDKKLTPLTTWEVEGEFINFKSKVSVLKAKKVTQLSTDIADNLKVLAVDIETYSLNKEILPKENPILMIGFYGTDSLNNPKSKIFRKVITFKKFKTDKDYIEFVSNEGALISRFREVIEEYKPDAIVGYFSDSFDMPYINTRAQKYNINLDLGLEYSPLKLTKGAVNSAFIPGIPHIDIYRFIRNTMVTSLKTDTLSLDSVSNELLGEGKADVDVSQLAETWDNKPEELERFCEYNLKDSQLTYGLFKYLFFNIAEMVKIVGLSLFDVTRMPFSQLVEWFLIKQTQLYDVLVMNKPNQDEVRARFKKTYKGAFVVEPKPGLYQDIAVFDFRSLYPSIIASHNISLSTFRCSCCEGKAKKVPVDDEDYWFCERKKGFISQIIEELITRRMRINEIMKKEKKENRLLLARSQTLKTLANSFYGYLGFYGSRWYSIESATSVTAWGRFYINQVIEKAEKEGFKVLYGDTDSVFLSLKGKARKNAIKFVEGVNQNLPGVMELEFEEFYPKGIFVSAKLGDAGAKKKYALLDESGNIKIKGFEMVRRNWSAIAKEVQQNVLSIILKEDDIEKAFKYVRKVINELKDKTIPVDKVTILTQVQKNLNDYETIGPHVAAAKRMKAKGYPIAAGSLVKYVVTKGKGKISGRVKLPEEVDKDDYDDGYYINNQVVPAVESIFKVLGYSKDDLLESKDQSKLNGFFK